MGILDEKIKKLVGDIFMSGACVSYYGPFTGPFRDNLVKQWKDKCEELEIPHSEKFALEEVMGNPVEI